PETRASTVQAWGLHGANKGLAWGLRSAAALLVKPHACYFSTLAVVWPEKYSFSVCGNPENPWYVVKKARHCAGFCVSAEGVFWRFVWQAQTDWLRSRRDGGGNSYTQSEDGGNFGAVRFLGGNPK